MELKALKNMPIKLAVDQPMIIEKEEITAGSHAEVKIPVGRMPSDTRIFIHTNIFRSLNPGPTVLILAGVHGDEINSIEIAAQLLEEEAFVNIQSGNIIVIPLLNVFGFNNFSRDVHDGKDVNRSFPGEMTGSMASRIAATITKKILPFVDIAIDLHTGGAARYNHPQSRFYEKDLACIELAMLFNSPFDIHQPLIAKSFRKTAKDHGIPALVYEAGESIRLSGMAIDEGKRGIIKTLEGLGVLPPKFNYPQRPSILVKDTSWQRANTSGIFVWERCSNDLIQKGDVLGLIKDPYGNKSNVVLSKFSGYIIGHNNASVVNQGDALFHIATDYEVEGF